MPKAYRVTRHTIKFDKTNIHDVYSVKPVNYGTLTTQQAAEQIAAESSLTPGDVKNVLDRYAYYVKENLKKGYAIELLGFGKLDIRFVKTGTVADITKATASLVKGMIPNFIPSFKRVNNSRVYDLIPERIKLVKYSGATLPEDDSTAPDDTTGGEEPDLPTVGGGDDQGGGNDSGGDSFEE